MFAAGVATLRSLMFLGLLIAVLCCGCTSFLHDDPENQDQNYGGYVHSEGQGSGI